MKGWLKVDEVGGWVVPNAIVYCEQGIEAHCKNGSKYSSGKRELTILSTGGMVVGCCCWCRAVVDDNQSAKFAKRVCSALVSLAPFC